MKIDRRFSSVAVGCVCAVLWNGVASANSVSEMVVMDTDVVVPTSNQGIWSSLMNISFDPAELISSQKKIKVPPAEQRLLEFGTLKLW